MGRTRSPTDVSLAPSPVAVCRIDLDDPALTDEEASRFLDAGERSRAERFVQPLHRRRWRAGRFALRQLLGAATNVDPGAIRFGYGEHGKPYWQAPDIARPPYFNLTHSSGVALLAITALAPVGIDIEAVRPLPDMDGVARRVFTAAERSQYRAAGGAARVALFFRGWTRKEAVLKARGTGLATPLKAFAVSLATTGAPCEVASGAAWRDGLPWWLADVDAGAGYAAAIALRTDAPVDVVSVDDEPGRIAALLGRALRRNG